MVAPRHGRTRLVVATLVVAMSIMLLAAMVGADVESASSSFASVRQWDEVAASSGWTWLKEPLWRHAALERQNDQRKLHAARLAAAGVTAAADAHSALDNGTAAPAPLTRYPHERFTGGCLREAWFTQRLDHFSWPRAVPQQPTPAAGLHTHTGRSNAYSSRRLRTSTSSSSSGGADGSGAAASGVKLGLGRTFQQRYFICEKYWSTAPGGRRGPIFFYAGNEGDVTMYINNTGLMWENAASFGALMVFAEHRYYGKTEPLGVPDSWSVDPSFLSVEQALADYAGLLHNITHSYPGAVDSPVIAFGGSYGGMLAAWMRTKYPHLVAGSIAASAPIGAFVGVPGFQPSRFWEVVTFDATEQAGAAPGCTSNIAATFRVVQNLGKSEIGRASLMQMLQLCEPLDTTDDVTALAYWIQGAFDAFAMGNYPYPSTYISGDPEGPLPAWPMRAACALMTRGGHPSESDYLRNMRDVVGMLYNASGKAQCFDVSLSGPAAGNVGPWDWQWCTEGMGQELPYFPSTGTTDMFWNQGPFDVAGIEQHCLDAWGVTPRWAWMAQSYGGLDVRAASNIVFSNGEYDPWAVFGVLYDINPNIVVLPIAEGAHHLDLMFTHPADPPSVRAARQVEREAMAKWIGEASVSAAARRSAMAAQGTS